MAAREHGRTTGGAARALAAAGPPRRERDIQREILRLLRTLPGVVAWRLNVGAMRAPDPLRGADAAPRPRFVRFGAPGMPDLVGWKSVACPVREAACGVCGGTGRAAVWLAVEVKRPGQRPTPAQAAWLAAVRAAGGIALVAHGAEDVLREPRLRARR